VIFAQVLSTIANMCESTETATAAFNRSGLLPALLQLLSPATPPALAVEAAQLLFVVSEENSRLAEFLSSSSSSASPSSPSSPLSTLVAAMTANNISEAKQGWFWSINAEAVLSGQCDMRTASSSSSSPPPPASSSRVILSPQVAIAGTVVNVLGGLSGSGVGKALTAQLLPAIIHTLSLALDVDPIERAGKLAQELQRLKAIVDHQIAEVEKSRPEETKSKSKSKSAASSSAAVDIDGDGDGEGEGNDNDSDMASSVTQEGNVTVIVEGKGHEEKLSDKDPVVEIQNRWVQVVELLTNEWTEQVRAVKQALEILTNICTSGQAEGKEEEERTAFICKLFLQHNVLMKVVSKLNLRLSNAAASSPAAAILAVLDGVIPNAEDVVTLCQAADQCRGRAVTCLANVVMALPAKALGDVRGLFLHAVSLVEPLALQHQQHQQQQQPQQPNTDNKQDSKEEKKEQEKKAEIKKQEAVTQELALLTLLLCNIVQTGAVQEVEKNHLMMFLHLMCNGRSEEIRSHVISLVAALGQLPSAHQYNAMIGTALLEVLAAFPARNPYVSFEVISECLNALIDLYSDDDLHAAVYKQLQITNKLLAFLAPVAQQLQSVSRKLDPAVAERLAEAVDNGLQFIEYKKARGA